MRKRIPDKIVTKVLIMSRRRCCLCWGIKRSHNENFHGQIAHLDRNHENTDEDNLAYICNEHHAIYDSRSPQTKGMTPDEAKEYRKELYAYNRTYFKLQDPQEETEIVLYVIGQGPPVTFRAIRRHVYSIICSETRPAQTQRQLNELIQLGVITEVRPEEYITNDTLLAELSIGHDWTSEDRKARQL